MVGHCELVLSRKELLHHEDKTNVKTTTHINIFKQQEGISQRQRGYASYNTLCDGAILLAVSIARRTCGSLPYELGFLMFPTSCDVFRLVKYQQNTNGAHSPSFPTKAHFVNMNRLSLEPISSTAGPQKVIRSPSASLG